MRFLFSAVSVACAAAAIAACLWLGTALQAWLRIPVPGALLGMVLLWLGLLCLPRVPEGLQTVSGFLLRNMSLWLIPSVVAVLAYLDLLRLYWLPLLLAAVLGTAATLAVTAWVFRRMLRRGAAGKRP